MLKQIIGHGQFADFGLRFFTLGLTGIGAILLTRLATGQKSDFLSVLLLIAPGSIPRSLLRTFNFEIWKLKCLGACPEDLYC